MSLLLAAITGPGIGFAAQLARASEAQRAIKAEEYARMSVQ